jgi:hypothetical protein
MLALFGLVIVVFAGLGWYLGWYHVAVTPGSDGHKKVEVDFNASKVHTDVSAGIGKGKELIDSFRNGKPVQEGSPEFVGPPKPTSTPAIPGAAGTPGPVPFK